MADTAVPAITRAGTMGRVYGGDPNLVHVPDGWRRATGARAAKAIDLVIRTVSENIPWPMRAFRPLCPGCYMVVLFNAAIALARANGQPLTELGRSMGAAFDRLATTGDDALGIEEIAVLLDPSE